VLRTVLGVLAISLAVLYFVQAATRDASTRHAAAFRLL
jgi:hypothetical protein